ncbi:MAG: hypothetical protein IJZ13_06225 [Clostridia bacterium]|nr:hypothetical protein [Clostridia bacterium]
MDKKITGIVSYITIVGWLIAYLAGDKEGAKFHLNQSLVLAITGVAASVLGSILGGLPFFGGIIGIVFSVVGVAVFALSIVGIIYAAQGQDKELPVIGSIKILK